MSFTQIPEPHYYAVIFTTMRINDPNEMVNLKLEKDWKDEGSITNWKNNLEHRRAKEKGIADWYKKYFYV